MNLDDVLADAALSDVDPDVDAAWRTVEARGGRRRLRRRGAVAAVAVVVLAAGAVAVGRGAGDGDVDVAAERSDGGSPEEWTAIPDGPLSPRQAAVSVWTGSEMLIVGGNDAPPCSSGADCLVEPSPLADGAAFSPTTNSWRSVSDAPVQFTDGAAVWNGDRALVYAQTPRGGQPAALLAYDPISDDWEVRAEPPQVSLARPAWTADSWVFAARSTTDAGQLWRYLPQEDRWEALPPDPIGAGSDRSIVASDGDLILISSVFDQPGQPVNGLYRAAILEAGADEWRALPDPRIENNGGTWISGFGYVANLNTSASDDYPYGGVLDIDAQTWSDFPSTARRTTAGASTTGYYGEAGRWLVAEDRLYEPSTMTWHDIPPRPDGVRDGVAAWTGTEIITWGGVLESAESAVELSAAGYAYRPPSAPGAQEGGSDSVDVADQPPPTVPAEENIPPESWSGDALGAGSWTGARTSADGPSIIITFVGGPPYDPDDPCSIAYRAETAESDSSVEVNVLSHSPPPDGDFGCTSEGHFRTLRVQLQEPLGGRTLVESQFDREQPVFDGSLLAKPTWLPEGWALRTEGPGYPDPESMTSWQRAWGGEVPAPTGDRCTPSDAAISLTQGPPDLIGRYPSNGDRPISTHDVHGEDATYSADESGRFVRLSWVESEQGFVLASMPGCVDDEAPSLDRLLRFARGLQLAG